jgi:hypothetical protein
MAFQLENMAQPKTVVATKATMTSFFITGDPSDDK